MPIKYLCPSIHTPVNKSMWQAHPDQPNIHVICPTICPTKLDGLTKEWELVKARIQDLCKSLSSNPSFSSIQYLKEAYIRALVVLIWLEKDFGAWRDFIEVSRNFQQSLLELLAFLDWWEDICAGDEFWSLFCHVPTQGAIFEDAQLYENYAHWSIGLFFLSISPFLCLIPPKKLHCHLAHCARHSPCPSCPPFILLLTGTICCLFKTL